MGGGAGGDVGGAGTGGVHDDVRACLIPHHRRSNHLSKIHTMAGTCLGVHRCFGELRLLRLSSVLLKQCISGYFNFP